MAQEASTIARPYAEAVYRLAAEQGTLDGWSELLAFYTEVVKDPAAKSAIVSPKLSTDQIAELMLSIGEGRTSVEGANFIRVLADNGRLSVIPEIAALYERHRQESQGALSVEVASAFPLEDDQAEAVSSALKARLGRDINLTHKEDPELIGGVRIRAGDLVIDGSVQAQLQQLAKELGI